MQTWFSITITITKPGFFRLRLQLRLQHMNYFRLQLRLQNFPFFYRYDYMFLNCNGIICLSKKEDLVVTIYCIQSYSIKILFHIFCQSLCRGTKCHYHLQLKVRSISRVGSKKYLDLVLGICKYFFRYLVFVPNTFLSIWHLSQILLRVFD
jgi:hypothetical protein